MDRLHVSAADVPSTLVSRLAGRYPLLHGWRTGFSLMALLIAACSSNYRGVECQGEVKSLAGQPVGMTRALIIDRYASFTITTAQGSVESGMLHSADRTQFIPSAVTREGFLAQRVSDKKFTLINSRQDQWITYTCP
ncbi:hypothetical protein ABK905_16945 [Acerihabitans sp. KWT182]|uniref:Lipoprotein n=1 Tax=Acerihabitans sp. KWT182 TaxID=3157919 RepID=A0AAU7Q5K4_9GAMM